MGVRERQGVYAALVSLGIGVVPLSEALSVSQFLHFGDTNWAT
jgi:hypothetical protein